MINTFFSRVRRVFTQRLLSKLFIRGSSFFVIAATIFGSVPLAAVAAPPPMPTNFTASKTNAVVGESITFSATIWPDPDGQQVEAVFDFAGTWEGTGYITPSPSGTQVSRSHSWATAGTYGVRVRAKDNTFAADGESAWTAPITITIGSAPATVPADPSNLRLDPTPTASTIYLKWNDNSTNEDKFNVERSLASANSWTLLLQTAANIYTYSDMSVAASTYYDYRVQACLSGSGCSAYTYLYNVSTSGAVPGDVTLPGVPSSFTVLSTNSSSVTLQWTAPGDDGTTGTVSGYEVRISANPLGIMTPDGWWSQAGLASNVAFDPVAFAAPNGIQKAIISSLAASATNYFGVRARDEVPNWSPVAGPIAATTTAAGAGDTTSPAAVDPWAGSIASTTAYISWSVPGDDGFTGTANSYELRYSTVTPGSDLLAWWSSATLYSCLVYPVPAPVAAGSGVQQSMTVGCLSPSTNYYFGMRAKDEVPNISSLTSTLSIVTPSGTTGMISPTMLRPEPAPTSTTIYLKWNDNSTNEERFNLERSFAGANIWSRVAEFGTNVTAYGDSSIESGKRYDYRVQACAAAECSGFAYLGNVMTAGGTGTVSLSGKVLRPDGVAVSKAHVGVWNASGGYNAETDASGYFLITNIPGGTYEAQAYPPSGATDLSPSEKVTFSFATGEAKIKDFALRSLAISGTKTISGRVTFSDGSVASDAEVSAWQEQQNLWTRAVVDSTGAYTLKVSGGSWKVGAHSTSGAWFGPEPVVVEFIQDSSTESKPVNFIIPKGSATVRGTVVISDGRAIPADTLFANLKSGTQGQGFGGPVGSGGTFQFSVVPGSYEAFIYSKDPNLAPPGSLFISIAAGQTSDLGTITVRVAAAAEQIRISGRVKDTAGNPLAQMFVGGEIVGGGAWASSPTGNDGFFTLTLPKAGTWRIGIHPPADSPYVPTGREISVAAGQTLTLDFIMVRRNASVTGTVVDTSGNLVSVYGTLMLFPADGFGGSVVFLGEVRGGQFLFTAPEGNWKAHLELGTGSGYFAPGDIPVAIAADQSVTLKFTVNAPDATLSGALRDSAGAVKTGIAGAVILSRPDRNLWVEVPINSTTGLYSIRLAAGTWYGKVRLQSSQFFVQSPDFSLTITSGQSLTKDFTLSGGAATLTGRVLNVSGQGVAAHVEVSTVSFAGGSTLAPQFFGTDTDASGNFTLQIPAGGFFARAFSPQVSGQLPPTELPITLAVGETKTIELRFKTADFTLTGKTMLDNGSAVSAFVWAWSKSGAHAGARSGADGSFTLSLTRGDSWYVGAEAGDFVLGEHYKAAPQIIDTSLATSAVITLTLPKVADLPAAQSATFDPAQTAVASLENGAQVRLPSNAVSVSGTPTLSLTPNPEVPSLGNSVVIGTAYEISARDANGLPIQNLTASATVSLPYDDVELSGALIEENLRLAFLDEASNVWTIQEGSVVDTVNNLVTGLFDHLTRFAIVAPADTTPPVSPTSISVQAGSGSVTLSWVNPTSDFHSVRIYRSTTVGQAGSFIVGDLKDTSHRDSGLVNGTKYYYNLRSVDLAGNESTSLVQTAATPSGSVAAVSTPTTQFSSGTLLRVSTQSTVWYVENGQRRGIPSLAAFESRGLSWGNVKVVGDASHLNLYGVGAPLGFADGAVVKSAPPTVYIIADGKKLPVASAEVFLGLGYTWNEIRTVSDGELALHATGTALATSVNHPNGSLVKTSDNPTVWFIQNGERRGVQTLQVFESWHFRWGAVRVVSSEELEGYPVGAVLTPAVYSLVKSVSAPQVYFIEGDKKRHIETAEAFVARNFDWNRIIGFASEVVDAIPTGLVIR